MSTDSPDASGLTPKAPQADEPRDARGSSLSAHIEERRAEIKNQVAHAREQFEEVNERIKQRTGRDLIVAVLSGLVLAALVVGTLVFAPPAFAGLAVIVSGLATLEVSRAMQHGGRRVDAWPQVVGAVLITAAGYFGSDMWQVWVLLIVVVVILVVWRLVAQMMSSDARTYGDVVADVAASAFLPMYVPFLIALAMVLLHEPRGAGWIFTFLVIVVAADTGAYAVGVWLGKHPMVPKVSPKKTWEGFGGAAVAALTMGALLSVFLLGLPWWAGLIFGLVVLITATLGDLGESLIKRDLGIKDMSSWIPGHGGLLDRLDSILPSAGATLALCFIFTPLVGAS